MPLRMHQLREPRTFVRSWSPLAPMDATASASREVWVNSILHLSPVSLRLGSTRKYQVGDLLEIDIPVGQEGVFQTCIVEVCHVRPLHRQWAATCTWCNQAKPWNRQATEAESERRSGTRYACNLHSICAPMQSRHLQPWAAMIEDLSNGGMRITAPRRFEQGALLRIEVETEVDDSAPLMVGRVTHLQSQPTGSYSLGCTFTSALDNEDVHEILTACFDSIHQKV